MGQMLEKKSCAEEIFERRKKLYQKNSRTKHPWQQAAETCCRVNDLLGPPRLNLSFPEDFALTEGDFYTGKVPLGLFTKRLEYDPTQEAILLHGTGGTVELGEEICKVSFTRLLLSLALSESCGECTFCRIGTVRMEEILGRIENGTANSEDLNVLIELAPKLRETGLCETGKNAAAPVLTALQLFSAEFEEHVKDRYCRAGTCCFASTRDR